MFFLLLNRDVHAIEAKYLKYNCPIFNKYVICASGFNEVTKNEIKQLVESEGGTYSGDLICGTTTHLISNEPKGTKYQYAKLWKINVVKSAWAYDSKKAHYCLPEKNYQLESSNHTSTPTDSIFFNNFK
jgi:NAD-dependent DNA ligase